MYKDLYHIMVNNKMWEKFLKAAPTQTSAISASIQYSVEDISKAIRKYKRYKN